MQAISIFKVDFQETRRKFFMAVNSILSNCKYTSDIVKLELLETHSLLILLYAVECINISKTQCRDLNSWWNSVYRKIFGYNKWESVKELIFLMGRLNVLYLVNIRQLLFIKRLSILGNFTM